MSHFGDHFTGQMTHNSVTALNDDG